MIELAWFWLRHQPDSALSRWFQARVGDRGSTPGLKHAVKKDGPANPSPMPSSMRDYGPSPQARPDVR
jgi:hypothetical protein